MVFNEIILHQDYLTTNEITKTTLPKSYFRLQVDPNTGPVGIDNTNYEVLKQLLDNTEEYLRKSAT